MRKVYYEIVFKTETAMNIGCGVNDNSDRDVLKDGAGRPFIPGSTMAGIYRSIFNETEDTKKYFGDVTINKEVGQSSDKAIESKIKTYDAVACGDYSIKKRDCVGLDDYRTAKKGAKFDFEVIEPSAKFITYIEQDIDRDLSIDIGQLIISKWKSAGLSFGAKTMRGLGRTSIEAVRRCEFNLEDNGSRTDWIDFDMYGREDSNWVDFSVSGKEINEGKFLLSEQGKRISIELELKQKNSSGISIRQYTTDVSDGKKAMPDYVQLTSNIDGEAKPVIPGTSWAGAFKHHMEQLLMSDGITKKEAEDETKKWFGSTSKRSSISFSESKINDSKPMVISRNAIDRFSGGTADGALYTEKYYYGGKTKLTISVPCISDNDKLLRSLVASVFDLHFGFMATGGLSSVGRGLFDITDASIDGVPIGIPGLETKNVNILFNEWVGKLAERNGVEVPSNE